MPASIEPAAATSARPRTRRGSAARFGDASRSRYPEKRGEDRAPAAVDGIGSAALQSRSGLVAVAVDAVVDDQADTEGPRGGRPPPRSPGAAALAPAGPADEDTRIRSPPLIELVGLDGDRALPGAEPVAHHVDESLVAVGLDRPRPCRTSRASCRGRRCRCASSHRRPTPVKGSRASRAAQARSTSSPRPMSTALTIPGGKRP